MNILDTTVQTKTVEIDVTDLVKMPAFPSVTGFEIATLSLDRQTGAITIIFTSVS